MFCRFCGKPIQEDSVYCPYCGKQQESHQETNVPSKEQTKVKRDKSNGINIATLSVVATICFYTGIVGFLILFMKMAPGIGGQRFSAYLIGAITVIVVAVVVHKIRDAAYTKRRQMLALVFGLILLIPSVILRIVYEYKVDDAVADIPKSGFVYVRVKLDEEFYSPFTSGLVREPYSYLTINGEKTEGSIIQIELNKAYSAKIGVGYAGVRTAELSSDSTSGKIDKTITITQKNLKNGYTIKATVPLDGIYADVTVTFERVCTFWDVIRYSPS